MKLPHVIVAGLAGSLLSGCAPLRETGPTIDSLNARVIAVEDDTIDVRSRDKAIAGYQQYLNASTSQQETPEVMRRLADLRVERGDDALSAEQPRVIQGQDAELGGADYKESIALYERVLSTYADYALSDQVLYQLAKAYEHTGQNEKVMAALNRLVAHYPSSPYYPEAQFRRGEILFGDKRYSAATSAYQAVINAKPRSAFHDHALYKIGWAHFKQSDYPAALDALTALLDKKLVPGVTLDTLPRAERELLEDTLRLGSLCFSYQSGSTAIEAYFNQRGGKPYEDLIYQYIGDLYLEKERYTDAAKTYAAFVSRHPYHRKGPQFQTRVIEFYRRGDFPSAVLEAQQTFVKLYRLDSIYWDRVNYDHARPVVAALKANLTDLARHFRAKAQATRKLSDYQGAANGYRVYLDLFPRDTEAPAMNFLLAEILFETRQYRAAAVEYERSAYDYPAHSKAAEAGYAALLAYRELTKHGTGTAKAADKRHSVQSALRFAERFPKHTQAAAVLTKISEDLYGLNQFEAAAQAARRVTERHPGASADLRRTAWTVVAHSAFDTQDYAQAESAYQYALELTPSQHAQRGGLQQRLAAAVYKQGETARAADELPAAVDHFLRVGKAVPQASIRATAEYDAAAALLEMKAWRRAAGVLEEFRIRYPRHELQGEVTRKLAVAYQQSGQGLKAAAEFERIGADKPDLNVHREALWQAFELYQAAEADEKAIAVLKRYIKVFPSPAEAAIEARQHLVEIYRHRGDGRRERYWLQQIIEADKLAGPARTQRSRYLAAHAALALARRAEQNYRMTKLKAPLKKNLKKKRRSMEKALAAFGDAVDYGIESVTTESTYHIANLYHDFAKALLVSERPKGLSADALEQYEILLEEQAFPFEVKAIELYEVNVKRMSDSVYDAWVKQSIERLAELMPVRYAKLEKGETVVDAID